MEIPVCCNVYVTKTMETIGNSFNAAQAVDQVFGEANLMNFAHVDHSDVR